jgi:hypothetical protein
VWWILKLLTWSNILASYMCNSFEGSHELVHNTQVVMYTSIKTSPEIAENPCLLPYQSGTDIISLSLLIRKSNQY